MANGCAFRNAAFFTAGERPVICPRPQRLYVRPSEPKLANDLLDMLLPKPLDSNPPFFCGSPPSRSDNPVVHDARFGEADPSIPVPLAPAMSGSGSASGFGSGSSRSGCARVRYGLAPAAVRVEGFDCRSRGIPAFA